MNENFLLKIMTALDEKGVKADYNKIKQMFDKDPAKINAVMDMSATKTEMNKFIKEYAPQLQKMFANLGVKVDLKDIESSMKSVFVESEKAAKSLANAEKQAYEMNKAFDKQRLADKKKLHLDEIQAYKENAAYDKKAIADKKSLFLSEEQAYKTNSSLRQKEIAEQKKLFLDEEQAYKTNNNIDAKLASDRNKLNIATKQAYEMNNKLNDSMYITKTRADGANKGFSAYIKTLKPQALKEYSTEINKISNSFSEAAKTGNKSLYSKANASLSAFKSNMKNAGMETASFTTILKQNISAFSNWYLIGGAVSGLIGDFKEAIATIKEVDTQLTEISKTSNLNGDALKQLGIDAYDAASKYGTTIQDYLAGFLEMSRGTDEATAKGLASLSILAQSAGDMNADLANAYIVATNAAFGYNNEVSKLNAVLDGQNQITNRNQVSMTDLAEATKAAGSQAAQSGVEVDEMTAAMGTMIASTKQGGEIAGRAFKGILMNLQQVSGEIDGEVFNEDSFKKAEKALSDVGVATEEIVDGTAKLRDPIEILKELADVYNSLPTDSVEKANIIADLGGKVYHVIQKCITRIYLIAGNTLEPYTTI